VMIGLHVSSKPKDKNHQYGHERFESLIAKLLADILLLTAVAIAYKALKVMITKDYSSPGMIAIYAAIISIIIKEWMYRYTLKGAKKMDSSAVLADAWHHRSDALSSVGTLIGIAGARMGYLIMDPIASLIISLFIGKIAIDIYIQSVKELMDHAADDATIDATRKEIMTVKGVIHIDSLKTRLHANKLFVDVEIAVDGSLLLKDAHLIAEIVHKKVENTNKKVKHCMVHVNPG